jgi:IclR family mhp operon transcriptional activator
MGMARTSTPRRKSDAALTPSQVLLRGLSVLEALNLRPISSVEQIAAQTGLPKSTTVRILQNLASKGYAQRLPMRKGYVLCERVLNLSKGFHSPDALVETSRPLIAAFTARFKWPVSLATLELDTMRVRASSSAESPFATSVDRARLNRRVPLLLSAHGRAYLAFCPDDEREIILSLLRASSRPNDIVARDDQYVSALIATIRRTGYAITAPVADEPAIGLAVPISAGGRVLATISLRYLGRAISEKEVAKRYLEPLRALATALSTGATKGTAAK